MYLFFVFDQRNDWAIWQTHRVLGVLLSQQTDNTTSFEQPQQALKICVWKKILHNLSLPEMIANGALL